MKLLISFMAVIMAISFSTNQNVYATVSATTDSVKVWGNCEMCKNRIEKAAKQAGATTAVWSEDTHMLSLTFPAKVSLSQIEKKVAAVGHDTGHFSAPDETYQSLPGCCKYERKEAIEPSSASATKKCIMENCNIENCNMPNCNYAGETRGCCKATKKAVAVNQQ